MELTDDMVLKALESSNKDQFTWSILLLVCFGLLSLIFLRSLIKRIREGISCGVAYLEKGKVILLSILLIGSISIDVYAVKKILEVKTPPDYFVTDTQVKDMKIIDHYDEDTGETSYSYKLSVEGFRDYIFISENDYHHLYIHGPVYAAVNHKNNKLFGVWKLSDGEYVGEHYQSIGAWTENSGDGKEEKKNQSVKEKEVLTDKKIVWKLIPYDDEYKTYIVFEIICSVLALIYIAIFLYGLIMSIKELLVNKEDFAWKKVWKDGLKPWFLFGLLFLGPPVFLILIFNHSMYKDNSNYDVVVTSVESLIEYDVEKPCYSVK